MKTIHERIASLNLDISEEQFKKVLEECKSWATQVAEGALITWQASEEIKFRVFMRLMGS